MVWPQCFTDPDKWRVAKVPDGRWMVWSPERIRNGFDSWAVAIRFAVLMAFGLPVMAHRFRERPQGDGRCVVCEEFAECHTWEGN